jgi:hypothetical protein
MHTSIKNSFRGNIMSEQLISQAQELMVMDPSMAPQMGGGQMHLVPLEVSEVHPNHPEEAVMDPIEVKDQDDPLEIKIIIDDIAGAPKGTKDPEEPEELEVSEEDDKAKADENEAKKSAKLGKWDWPSKGAHGFVVWIKERIDDVPKHSGYDSAGLERAVSYLEKLDNEISKAMRLDLDGELDANKIEAVRGTIDEGIARLQDRLDKVKSSKKKSRKKKSEYEFDGIVKEAQKITGVQGVYITVPLLISRIARVCINGMVSAGHDIEDLYERQVKFYKLNDREQAEVMQLLADMGYAVRQDRGFMPDQDLHVEDSDNMDWAANYKG